MALKLLQITVVCSDNSLTEASVLSFDVLDCLLTSFERGLSLRSSLFRHQTRTLLLGSGSCCRSPGNPGNRRDGNKEHRHDRKQHHLQPTILSLEDFAFRLKTHARASRVRKNPSPQLYGDEERYPTSLCVATLVGSRRVEGVGCQVRAPNSDAPQP